MATTSPETIRHVLLDRLIGAFDREDLEATVEDFSDDTVFVAPLGLAPEGSVQTRGKDDLREFNRQFMLRYTRNQTESKRLMIDGDWALWHWHWTYAHRRSGKVAGVEGISEVQFRDGKIVYWRDFWDSAELLRSVRGEG